MLARLACLAVLFSWSLAQAQTVSGIISGSVADTSGSAIVGATVKLTRDATGDRRELQTDATGEFVFTSVLPGLYRIAVERQGFKRVEKSNLNITSAERLSAGRVVLEVGAVSESIEVTASGTAVEIESNEQSQLLTGDQLTELQSRGRNYMALFNVLPGAAPDERFFETDAMQSYLTPNFSGIASGANSVFVDGASATSVRDPNYSTTNLSVDSVAEVRVEQANYRAEDGRNGGAVIKTVIKSGTRQFHGSLYSFERNEFFNANSFINNKNGVARSRYRYNTFGGTIGGPVPMGRLNRNRDKLFFFYATDTGPTKSPGQQPLTQVTMPTALERSGDFSQTLDVSSRLVPIWDPSNNRTPFPGNVIPKNRISPAGQALLSLFPMPNFTNRAISNGNYNFVFLDTPIHFTHVDTIKLDLNATARLRGFVRVTLWRQDDKGYAQGGQSWPMIKAHYQERFHTASLNASYTVTPTLVFEMNIGLRAAPAWRTPEDPLGPMQRSSLGVALGQLYPANNTNNLLPQMSFGGVPGGAAFGGANLLSLGFPANEPMMSLMPSVTKIHGSHTLKAGGFGERPRVVQASTGNFAGNISFSRDTNNALETNYAYSNAIIGTYQSYQETDSRPQYDIRGLTVEWYLQDTWKVNRRLTLDYGMRFTWFTPYRQANDKSLNFIPGLYDPKQAAVLYRPVMSNGVRLAQNPLTGATLPAVYIGAIVPGAGNPLNGTLAQSNPAAPNGFVKNHGVLYGPRFGFAYDLTGDGKTALRGGFGVSYNIRPYPSSFVFPTVNNTQNSFTNYYGTLDSLGSITATLFPRSITGLNPDAKVPTIFSYSLNIQRQLGHGTVLSVAYVGTQSRQLQNTNSNVNTVPFGAQFQPQARDTSNNGTLSDNFFRPYPGYSSVVLPGQVTSNYHGLQTSVLRRFSKGIQFGGSWTWSKAMGYQGYGQYYDNHLNYGKLSIDHTHLLSLNYLYSLPRASRIWNVTPVKWVFDGWQTSSVITFASGRPYGVSYSVLNGVNITGGGDYNRAVVVASPNVPWSERTRDRYFNTAAFAMSPQVVGSVRPGNAPQDNIHGPGRNNFDMTFSKNFRVKERKNLQFRWELYNIFNHPSFYQVNTTAQFTAATGVQANQSFGQLTNTLTPRVMQLALRFTF
jgi:hypothetical protein